MSSFIDALLNPTEENVAMAIAGSLSRRDEMGMARKMIISTLIPYRKKVGELLDTDQSLEQRERQLLQIRTELRDAIIRQIEDEPGWAKKLKNDPEDKVATYALTTYLQICSDLGFFNAAVDIYDKVPKESYGFRENPNVLLDLAYSYNYRSQSDITGGRTKSEPEKALTITEHILIQLKGTELEYHDQYLSPKIAGVIARSKVLIAEKTAAEPTTNNSREVLYQAYREARKLHTEQFTHQHGYHHYSAYNVMIYSAMLGELDSAKDISNKLYLTTMRDGGIFAADNLTVFRTTMAMVINPDLARLLDDQQTNNTVHNALAALQKKIIEPAQKRAFIRDAMKVVSGLKGDSQEEVRIRDVLRNEVIPALLLKKIYQPELVNVTDSREILIANYAYQPAVHSIIPGAGNGRGVSIGGNLSKGGLIADINITPYDYFALKPMVEKPLSFLAEKLGADETLFPENMRHKSLKQLAKDNEIGGEKGPGQLFEATRLLVREIFQTKRLNMENMDAPGHVEFEKGLRALYALGGFIHKDYTPLDPKNSNDKTIFAIAPSSANLSFFAAARSGDCRMYKILSGLLVFIASASAENDTLWELDSGEIDLIEAKNRARDIRRVQLLNFDLDLYGQAVAEDKKWPVRNEMGYFELNKGGEAVLLEPHSVNLSVERKPDGSIEYLYLSCTFYNGEYRDGSGEIVKGATYDLRVEITPDMIKIIPASKPGQKPSIEIDLTGKTGFKLWDRETGKAEDASLSARPSKYSHTNIYVLSAGQDDKAASARGGVYRSYGTSGRFLGWGTDKPSINILYAWLTNIPKAPKIIAEILENILPRPPVDVPPDGTSAEPVRTNTIARQV